jgi:hypothetical protein
VERTKLAELQRKERKAQQVLIVLMTSAAGIPCTAAAQARNRRGYPISAGRDTERVYYPTHAEERQQSAL